jgi:RNA polymerase sigma-70 factor, ECF subfamily
MDNTLAPEWVTTPGHSWQKEQRGRLDLCKNTVACECPPVIFDDELVNDMTDRDALKRWFGESVEQYMNSFYSVAYRLTNNRHDADDLVAESVANAWKRIDSLEDRNRFRPWLLRIIHNRFISDYRKRSVRPQELHYEELPHEEGIAAGEISELLIRQPDGFIHWWANPEKEFINSLLGEQIVAAIDSLPELYRATITLVNIEGLSYDAAAEVLEIPPGTVRSRMKKARTLLQKALWQHGVDAGLIVPDTKCGEN